MLERFFALLESAACSRLEGREHGTRFGTCGAVARGGGVVRRGGRHPLAEPGARGDGRAGGLLQPGLPTVSGTELPCPLR